MGGHQACRLLSKDSAALGVAVQRVTSEHLWQYLTTQNHHYNCSGPAGNVAPQALGVDPGGSSGVSEAPRGATPVGSQVTHSAGRDLAFLLLSPGCPRQRKNSGKLEKARLVFWEAWGSEGSLIHA